MFTALFFMGVLLGPALLSVAPKAGLAVVGTYAYKGRRDSRLEEAESFTVTRSDTGTRVTVTPREVGLLRLAGDTEEAARKILDNAERRQSRG